SARGPQPRRPATPRAVPTAGRGRPAPPYYWRLRRKKRMRSSSRVGHASSPAVLDLAALKSAARAAIVIPALFAVADKAIGRPQTSLFAAFGSFALLVLTEFGGPLRTRFLAYLGLGC